MDQHDGDSVRLMDALKAAGEDNCARLVAAYLNDIGREAVYVDSLEAALVSEQQLRPRQDSGREATTTSTS